MPTICMPSPPFGGLPDFSGLMTFPPQWPSIPAHGLPTLPNPLFSNIRIPNLELRMIALEMQAVQYMNAATSMIGPLLSKLNLSLDLVFPPLPGFGDLNLSGLLSGALSSNLSHLAMIRNMSNFVPPGFSLPLYPTLKIPDISAIHCWQISMRDNMMSCINTIPSKIDSVIGILKDARVPGVPDFPGFPALPSMDDIMGAMMSRMSSLIPGVPSFSGMARAFAMGSFTMASLMSGISIPNFPSLPSFNYPTIPSLTIPDIEIVLHTMAFSQHVMTGALSSLSSFIGGIPGMSFSIPTVPCISF